jgi:cell division initiation protein
LHIGANFVKGVIILLTPADIENAEFKRVARGKGYDCDEVDDFLDLVIVEFEKMLKENTRLNDKIGVMNDAIQHYKDMEDTLKASIVKSEKTAEDTRNNAKTEADQITNEAKQKAKEIIDRAHNEQYRIEIEINRVKGQYEALKAKMKTLLNSELELLETAADDFQN